MLLIWFLKGEIRHANVFLKITKRFGVNKKKDSVGFSKNALKKSVRHLIENCYFTVGNSLLRQKIGIPMSIDPAPFWANLFLYTYEEEHM